MTQEESDAFGEGHAPSRVSIGRPELLLELAGDAGVEGKMRGLPAVEMFLLLDGQILINALALREQAPARLAGAAASGDAMLKIERRLL